MTTGPALYMVCYKTSPDSYQTYWDVIPANSPEKATRQAERNGLFQHGRRHIYTCGYNRAGMTVEETYAAYLSESREAGRQANEEGLPREAPSQHNSAEWLRGWDDQQVVREQWYELHE